MEEPQANLIDTHAHLAWRNYLDIDAVIQRSKQAGVSKIICVTSATREIAEAIAVAEKYHEVYLSLGIHPQDTKETSSYQLDLELKTLESASSHPKVVAIGECGFDFSNPPPNERSRDPKEQEYIFEFQTRLAQKQKLPQVLHCRQAKDEMVGFILKHKITSGVWHCFVEDGQTANFAISCGLLLSFNGIVTYRGGTGVLEIARTILSGRLLLETDSPLLIPEPYRSNPKIKLNEPAYVKMVAHKISQARDMLEEDLAVTTSKNACDLFKLPYD